MVSRVLSKIVAGVDVVDLKLSINEGRQRDDDGINQMHV
jgi:hypothetical protein